MRRGGWPRDGMQHSDAHEAHEALGVMYSRRAAERWWRVERVGECRVLAVRVESFARETQ